MKCPCGANVDYALCCELIITGNAPAVTPEQLMRSRYSAYATKNADYIFNTYASSSQPIISQQDILDWANQTTWLNLNIIAHHSTAEFGSVEFIATYQHAMQKFELHEISRFIKEHGQWRYLDGEIKS